MTSGDNNFYIEQRIKEKEKELENLKLVKEKNQLILDKVVQVMENNVLNDILISTYTDTDESDGKITIVELKFKINGELIELSAKVSSIDEILGKSAEIITNKLIEVIMSKVFGGKHE